MLTVTTLASGSSGNCALVSDGGTHILIDAGISARRITGGLKALGVDPAELAGVLVTHEHSDHISGLNTLKKQLSFPLYTTAPTARQLCYRMAGLEERIRPIQPGETFALGSLEIAAFPTSHDCACPVGYTVTDRRGRRLAFATDLGRITGAVREAVRGCHLLVGECNYDPESLLSGPYPPFLKERILGERGHLSNEMGGELAAFAAVQGARQVVLAHLSRENNDPERAYRAAAQALAAAGAAAGRDVGLTVAPRGELSPTFEV